MMQSLTTSPRQRARPWKNATDIAWPNPYLGSSTQGLLFSQPATDEIHVRHFGLSVVQRKAIVVTDTQFTLRPTDNVKARVRDQDILVEDRGNIDCSKAFIGGEDRLKKNQRGVIIFHYRNYQLNRPPTVCHRFHPIIGRMHLPNPKIVRSQVRKPSSKSTFNVALAIGSNQCNLPAHN